MKLLSVEDHGAPSMCQDTQAHCGVKRSHSAPGKLCAPSHAGQGRTGLCEHKVAQCSGDCREAGWLVQPCAQVCLAMHSLLPVWSWPSWQHKCKGEMPFMRAAHKVHLSDQMQIAHLVSSPLNVSSTETVDSKNRTGGASCQSLQHITHEWLAKRSLLPLSLASTTQLSFSSNRYVLSSLQCKQSSAVVGSGDLVLHAETCSSDRPAALDSLNPALLSNMVCRQPSTAVGLPCVAGRPAGCTNRCMS